jgi:hypothetical protein
MWGDYRKSKHDKPRQVRLEHSFEKDRLMGNFVWDDAEDD